MSDIRKLMETFERIESNESVEEWEDVPSYSAEGIDGSYYNISFADEGNNEIGMLDQNDIEIAKWVIGGGGIAKAKINNPAAVLEAILAFAQDAAGEI